MASEFRRSFKVFSAPLAAQAASAPPPARDDAAFLATSRDGLARGRAALNAKLRSALLFIKLGIARLSALERRPRRYMRVRAANRDCPAHSLDSLGSAG